MDTTVKSSARLGQHSSDLDVSSCGSLDTDVHKVLLKDIEVRKSGVSAVVEPSTSHAVLHIDSGTNVTLATHCDDLPGTRGPRKDTVRAPVHSVLCLFQGNSDGNFATSLQFMSLSAYSISEGRSLDEDVLLCDEHFRLIQKSILDGSFKGGLFWTPPASNKCHALRQMSSDLSDAERQTLAIGTVLAQVGASYAGLMQTAGLPLLVLALEHRDNGTGTALNLSEWNEFRRDEAVRHHSVIITDFDNQTFLLHVLCCNISLVDLLKADMKWDWHRLKIHLSFALASAIKQHLLSDLRRGSSQELTSCQRLPSQARTAASSSRSGVRTTQHNCARNMPDSFSPAQVGYAERVGFDRRLKQGVNDNDQKQAGEDSTLGGMRRPFKAMDIAQHHRIIGPQVRDILDSFLDKHPRIQEEILTFIREDKGDDPPQARTTSIYCVPSWESSSRSPGLVHCALSYTPRAFAVTCSRRGRPF